jgi:hypothetical protein
MIELAMQAHHVAQAWVIFIVVHSMYDYLCDVIDAPAGV